MKNDTPNTDIKSLGTRIATLMQERDGLNEDIKEIYTEAKAAGIDTKALRQAIAHSRKDIDPEYKAKVNLYSQQMGNSIVFAE